jgi:hypothetical protein
MASLTLPPLAAKAKAEDQIQMYQKRSARDAVSALRCDLGCNWVETSNVSSRRCARLEITAPLEDAIAAKRRIRAFRIIMQIRTYVRVTIRDDVPLGEDHS